MSNRIESVAVVGAEIVGWSVAAALKRRLPYLSVTVVPAKCAKDDLANQLISTLPSIVGFHEDIGLTDADTVARAASALRLGSRFAGWMEEGQAYIHGYGKHGRPFDSVPFHQIWLRERSRGHVLPFQSYSLQARMSELGRVADRETAASNDVQFGLQIDRQLYLELISAYAVHLGVRSLSASYKGARLKSDGFIESVTVDDGSELPADLFIDCSGPSAVLRTQLGDGFEEWSEWLPCDRVLVVNGPPRAELPAVDEVKAVDAGWKWSACSPRATSEGIVYHSGFIGEGDAAGQLSPTAAGTTQLKICQGRRFEPWLRNCVALGGAAVVLEPLEWTGLHMVHSAVDRIISMMPGRDCAAVELSEYNRQSAAEAERIRDFICLHYVKSARIGSFWDAMRETRLPDSLRHTLDVFCERGRLPYYEEETFSRDSWLAVLLGQDVYPRRIDPLADLVPEEAALRGMSQLRDMIATAVTKLPTHESYLRNLFQQAAR